MTTTQKSFPPLMVEALNIIMVYIHFLPNKYIYSVIKENTIYICYSIHKFLFIVYKFQLNTNELNECKPLHKKFIEPQKFINYLVDCRNSFFIEDVIVDEVNTDYEEEYNKIFECLEKINNSKEYYFGSITISDLFLESFVTINFKYFKYLKELISHLFFKSCPYFRVDYYKVRNYNIISDFIDNIGYIIINEDNNKISGKHNLLIY